MRVIVLAAALLALGASPAGASTVALRFVTTRPGTPSDKYNEAIPPEDIYAVHLAGEDDERNDITVDDALRLRDDGAPLRAGELCSRAPDGWVTCAAPQRPGTT